MENGEAWKAANEAGTVPDALDPPEILDGFGGWYEDFWRLSTERQIGMGIGPIPASAIDRHVAGWGYEDADLFESCMRRMDEVYLMKANSTDKTPPAASPRDAFRDAFASKMAR